MSAYFAIRNAPPASDDRHSLATPEYRVMCERQTASGGMPHVVVSEMAAWNDARRRGASGHETALLRCAFGGTDTTVMARRTRVDLPVAIILIIVVLGSVAELTLGRESIDPWLIVLAAAPYLLAATCILTPRLRPLGLGLASGGAAVVALASAPLAFLSSFYVIPLLVGGETEAFPMAAVVALVPLHAVLAFSAFWALREAVPLGRSLKVMVMGAVAAAVYGFAVGVILEVRNTRAGEARARAYDLQHPAKKVFADLAQCITRHEASPELEWPASVDGLGPAGLNCVEAGRLRAADGRYEVRWAVPMRRTAHRVFTACVAEAGPSGWSARLLDEGTAGVVRESWDAAHPDTACAAAYARFETLRAMRYCLWRHAAEHASYPSTFGEVAACVPRRQEPGLRYTYAPGAPDADGRVTSFVVIEGRTTFEHGQRTRRMDETGAIRATDEPRLPLESDPIERPGASATAPASPIFQGVWPDDLHGAAAADAAIRACLFGTLAACAPAARLIAATQHATPQQQANLLERGCNGGNAASCFGLAQLAIGGQLPGTPPARGEQLRLIACSTAPVPDGCEQP